MMLNRKLLQISILFIIFAYPLYSALAVCPVCTVAVGAGVGLAQWLGIDDTISGLWIGGLAVSLIIWTINWLKKRNLKLGFEELRASASKEKAELWKKAARNILIALGYYLIIVGPLWWKGMIGHPYNKFCGVDKLLFGIILGTILFFSGVILHNYLRKRNESKSYFKGQKIVAAILPLVLASIILYFTC
ncbi:MAG: hypothetical protein COZ87_00450 [Candidatus Moranbacteria bacterium CG_4_8_14_3_um_filter_43_15]|nr:MAG: hypothetical protein COZ87_00450 [Candidatus Moranbacteria bacterium CG_4_8_14_3_um_filter_43_15]